jgi:nuclear pore complex protein Nup98-Nup96
MTDSNGDCLVENFTVGRVDYGCIKFHGITNVSNMNIDEIVHIRRKEVRVYLDDEEPPVGHGQRLRLA